MAGIAMKSIPVSNPISEDEFVYLNGDISVAMEYTGSPVNVNSIPRAFPVEVDQLLIAKVAASSPFLSNLSFPVAEPVVRVPQLVSLRSGLSDSKDNGTHVEEDRTRVSNDVDDDDDLPGQFDRNGVESSGPLGFSDSQDHSNELSESSDMVETPVDCEHILGFMNQADWNSNELTLTPPAFSSEVSGDYDSGKFSGNQEGECYTPGRRGPEKPAKRGLCYHCHRGNRFTEKEVCLVCDAKYCKSCVLKAMGSMPEGRKCLTCISFPVDESKRHLLGKCSRMLRGMLLESEVKQMMESELSSPANQLPPEEIFVNGRPLYLEELMLLRSCPNPPRNLKPGYYWYDRVAGFWGKEGQKPSQIITPQLNVGSQKMKREASNGNTDVMINGREITKAELWMLQSAGVQCAGSPTFWVDSEGYYQEEGMNVIKGKIWGRKRTKVLCAFLSLPTPESPNPGGQVNGTVDGVVSGYLERIGVCKVLLVGDDQSGTSTVYKQARLLYNIPFSEEERQNIKFSIQSNLYGYLGRLIEWCQQFEEESILERKTSQANQLRPSAMPHEIHDGTQYTIRPELNAFSDWLIKAMVSGNLDLTQKYASFVEELWKDAAIQATYSRRDELDLTGGASYFLDKAVDIAKEDYDPSDTDILNAEGITSSNGLASMEFSFSNTASENFRDPEQLDPIERCQLIRVNAKNLGENCKWLDMFEDAGIVLFCVSLIEYDEYKVNINGQFINKMLESKRLFESIVTHPTFDETNFLLLLTKFDLLGEKIEQVPLTHCEWFHDFNPLVTKSSRSSSNNKVSPLTQRGFHYIAVKFKKLFKDLTGRKLYVCPVAALESEAIGSALSYAREIIRWEEEKLSLSLNDSSSESFENEHSSYS